jgi:cytochrome c biogenesis factor
LAELAGVDPVMLDSVATKATVGDQVTAQEIAVLGQFDAVLSAVLDEAYERADQRYRNAAKLLAVIIATLLAIFGGWLVYYYAGASIGCPPAAGASPLTCPPITNVNGSFEGYLGSRQFWVAVLVGVSAAPIAPVAKDLASSLQAAVTAVGAVRRLAP